MHAGEQEQAGTAERNEPAMSERRRSPRAHLVVEMGLYSDTNFYSAFTRDISEGGVFVATYVPLPRGTQVTMEIAFPGNVELRATGTVRWTREQRSLDDEPPGMGIEFDEIDEESRELIREFVENREPYFGLNPSE